jgi:hypothetical protein
MQGKSLKRVAVEFKATAKILGVPVETVSDLGKNRLAYREKKA